MSKDEAQADVDGLIRKFLASAHATDSPIEVITGLIENNVAVGLPLDRVSLVVFLLHPILHGISFRWKPGQEVEVIEHEHGLQELPAFRCSPVAAMREGRLSSLHQSLEGEGPFEYNILQELKEEGFSDYLLLPLPFRDGSLQCLSLATVRPGGFSELDLMRIRGLITLTTFAVELTVQRHLTLRLLNTYLGPDAAKNVLAGKVRRGDGENINAVIFVCDLRGFTRFSDTHTREALLELLDAYFEIVVEAIRKQGGEVLKFIGDAVLAIFPSAKAGSQSKACAMALAAAREALLGAEEVRAQRKQEDLLPVNFGIALHLGEVMYGNIGARDRLDFTVIGPAVNMASRLEGMCRELERSVVTSDDFAKIYEGELEDMGEYEFKGIETPMRVHALSE